MDQEIQVSNSQRGQGAARADIVVWRSKEDKESKKYPLIVVECKAESVTIHKDRSWDGRSISVETTVPQLWNTRNHDYGTVVSKVCQQPLLAVA